MLKIGMARTDITPPVGVELCGYGYYLARQNTGVLDTLYARALYAEDSRRGQNVLLIASGLVGVDEPGPQADMARVRAGVCRRILDDGLERHRAYPAEVQALRVGPLRIAGVPGELFWSLGEAFFRGTEPHAMLAGYTNGWMGYFADRAAYGDPRFDYPTNHAPYLRGLLPFAPGTGERLVEAALGLCTGG